MTDERTPQRPTPTSTDDDGNTAHGPIARGPIARGPIARGPIAWMTRNSVSANLLAAVLVIGGLIVGSKVKQEVFPEFDLDVITISVPYPGASPSEVEQGILLALEEVVRGIDGVDRVTSVASEGVGTVNIELILGANKNKALADVKSAVDRVVTLPEDAERPVVSLIAAQREVIDVVLYGEVGERVLRNLAEKMREDLLAKDGITLVEVSDIRPLEIDVEVPRDTLRAYGLTLERIAADVRAAALELPGGGVKTPGGEVLLRLAERRDLGEQFENIPIVSSPSGTEIRLGELADVIDGFADTDQSATFNDKPAAMVKIYRVGDQTPIDVADIVRETLAETESSLPPGVETAIWRDWSETYRGRLDLLLNNAFIGLVFVFLTLALFLEARLAFWVSLGIPVSFLGTLLFMPAFDASINMISMFAFIVTLGMVVDDAIVIGENVFAYRRKGLPPLEAAIRGAREMALPVTFSILTTVAAFLPLFFVPGVMGKLFGVIPVVVITVLLISLTESLLVLPAHLSHVRRRDRRGLLAWVHGRQQSFSHGVEWFIERAYAPLVAATLRYRYVTIAVGLAILLATVGLIGGGRINFSFMPKVDSDIVSANAVLPFGAPLSDTKKVRDRLVRVANEILAEHGGEKIKRGLYAQLGSTSRISGPMMSGRVSGSHLTSVQVFMVDSDHRDITAVEFAKEWRERLGAIPGLESLTFKYTAGPSGGAAVDVRLSHHDLDMLERASAELASGLTTFKGVHDIDDGYERGKPQLDLRVRPEARALNVTASSLGRQVRSAFYGAEALRQQRGRDELRVMVRLPERERRSVHDVEELMVRTPAGGEMPLYAAAEVSHGHSYTTIRRAAGKRTIDVTADVTVGAANPKKIVDDLEKEVLPQLIRRYPGLSYSIEGEQRERKKSMAALGRGFILALVLIFALLAVPFRSYAQPLVVMAAIPFGLVGAVIGHVIMGFDLSIMSMMGIVALSGVVVNDSLILVDTANILHRDKGLANHLAIARAGVRRFRPIILTSLTTFFGLAPMIFETSVQARFLIPMAVSLGFGILFSTVIVLLIVPSLYLIVEDLRGVMGFTRREVKSPDQQLSI